MAVRQQLLIGGVGFLGTRIGRAIRTVVDERAYGHAREEFRETTNVIGMLVGEQQVIDPADTRVFGCGGNAAGVLSVVPCLTGIDEQRLPFRSDKESRLAAVDIDEVHLQITGRSPGEGHNAYCEPYEDSNQQILRSGFTHWDQAPPS